MVGGLQFCAAVGLLAVLSQPWMERAESCGLTFMMLVAVCVLIKIKDTLLHTATPKHIGDLYWNLHTRAFRGITLGVAALAWHCLGFDPGCPRDKAMKVLRDLRTKGSMSSSDILRYGHLKDKEQRNVLVKCLTAEGLIRIEGTTIRATTFAEFVDTLHSRPELPPTTDHPDSGSDNGGASAERRIRSRLGSDVWFSHRAEQTEHLGIHGFANHFRSGNPDFSHRRALRGSLCQKNGCDNGDKGDNRYDNR